jgi:cytochrome c oxidase subunit 1
MTSEARLVPYAPPAEEDREGLSSWLLTTDHKRIGILTIGTALVLFLFNGAMALTMRAQLAQPDQHILSPQGYLQFMTMHGTGMIALTITPLAVGLGVYLVPLQIGAPRIAAPRATLLGYWLYVCSAITLIWGFLTPGGASSSWWGYTPLSTSTYSPGPGQSLWTAGFFLSATGMILMSTTTLWTMLRMRAPGVSMMRMPVFCWTQLVTALMVVAAFPPLLAALAILALWRLDPSLFAGHIWNVVYENLFWFYGHPVVYVMFFPFVGCVAESLATFAGRRFFGYKGTTISLLAFATGSMAVWGHHMFVTGVQVNDYFSLTSIMLSVPAGIEYFGFLGTLWGGRHRYTTSMLFAMTFIPQFLVGGLTGILVANPAIDYQVNNTYFIVGHFHYTLFAGSVFGFFAGFYFWFPKATGIMLNERIGKLHWALLTIGANTTFIPFFILGYDGMPRWMATYPAGAGWTTLSLISSIGAGIIGLSFMVLIYNVYVSARAKVPAGPNPWRAYTLEWATSSPPPRYNFNLANPVPRVRSYAPLLDIWEQQQEGRREGQPWPASEAPAPGAPAPGAPAPGSQAAAGPPRQSPPGPPPPGPGKER